MPRRKWIDKATSTTYQLVHRPQNDPKVHDISSSSMVLQELAPSQAHKIKNRTDLEIELFRGFEGGDVNLPTIRDNEGEAAEHGIYFDDTEYDYMQHIRDLNAGNDCETSHFVEATARKEVKGKAKMSLEDALRNTFLRDGQSASNVSEDGPLQLLDEDILPSKNLRVSTYQDLQDIPDALLGFQPDMDPRLQEVLKALDDEAYVDDEDEFFGEIARDRKEISLEEFKEAEYQAEVDGDNDDDDDGWESNDTEKPKENHSQPATFSSSSAEGAVNEERSDHGDGDWMKEFRKFRQAEKIKKPRPEASNADLQSSLISGTSRNNRHQKMRKGAMTSSTGYSMTSSSLFRTEGQSLLDARFDKIEEDYTEDATDMDEGAASIVTGTSLSSSQAPQLTQRSDFDSIMDEFLGGYSMSGKKRVRKGSYQSGMEQLDEVRRGLGPARVRSQKV